jgi:photosystem II stability/assembly factor-like uncharacterized protein
MKTLAITLTALTFFVAVFLFFGNPHADFAKDRIRAHHVRTSGAMEALYFWAAARAYPKKVIPDEGYAAAFQFSRVHLKNPRVEALTDSWRPTGPHNIGGRTLAVAFNPLNPKTICVGSASGGLWRTYTGGIGGDAWDYVSTGFPVLAVSSIAIPPNDSNTIYIGTGEIYGYQNAVGGLTVRTTRGSYGMGILKTTDGGTSWTKVLDWSYNQRRGVNVIRINPQNLNSLWAGTTEGTYRSYDAGMSWQQVHPVIMAMDIAVNYIDTNIVFAACGDLGSTGTGIYRTTDGGANWLRLTSGFPGSWGGKAHLAVFQSAPNVIFASIGAGSNSGTWLCRSVNNGDSWTIVSTQDYSSYQGWYSHFAVVHPLDSSKVICGGIDLWKSTTGGTNLIRKSDWTAWYFGVPPPGGPEGPPYYSHADHHAFAVHPTNPNIVYFGTDGGVFRTTDFGETFEGRNGGYQTTQFYNGFSCAFTDSILSIGGLQDNATAIYEGTVAWRRVIGGDGCWTAIHTVNPDTIYGAYQNLSILKSVNRGQTWSGISPPSSSQTSFAAPYVLSPSRPRTMYAGRDKVYKSTIGGGSWVATNNNLTLDGNPLISLAVSFTNPDTVYAGTAPTIARAGIFRTTNGGTSWQNVTGTLPDRYPVDIAVDPTNSAVVYVAFAGFGTSHLFRSTDAGQTWGDIGAALPDVPTSSLVVDPSYPNHLYVGNDIGVYVSTNGGGSWQEFQASMPDAAIVMDLTISRSNRMLRAATHGNGAYERRLLEPTVGVHEAELQVSSFSLEQNYPNPFNATTKIGFRVQDAGFTSLKVYGALGREVATLVNEVRQPGTYEATWDASGMPSGVYFYRITAGELTQVRKALLLK